MYIYIYIEICTHVQMFTNDPGDLGSILGHVIPKPLKWYLIPLCLTLSNIKVRIKGKVERSWERGSALPYTWV